MPVRIPFGELFRRASLTREHAAKLERGLQVPRRVTLERFAAGLELELDAIYP